MMKMLVAVAVVGALVGAKSEADTIFYEYTGGIFDTASGTGDPRDYSLDALGSRYFAQLVLDERALRGSLRNASLSFTFAYDGPFDETDEGPVSGILGFRFKIGLDGYDDYPSSVYRPVAGANLTLNTDSESNIISGCYSYSDGPPDGSFGCGGDGYSSGYGSVLGPSGTWQTAQISPSPIPVPSAGLLLLFSVASIAALRRNVGRVGRMKADELT